MSVQPANSFEDTGSMLRHAWISAVLGSVPLADAQAAVQALDGHLHDPQGGGMKRCGQLIGLKPERYDEYVKAHAEVWPGVLAMIHACNIRNYSIFHRNGLMFAYFEYVGDDFEADMQRIADDPETQRWWNWMMPMQEPLADRAEGEWWTDLEEVFHTD